MREAGHQSCGQVNYLWISLVARPSLVSDKFRSYFYLQLEVALRGS